MAKPLVSVIVPVYNAQKTVPAALDSLLKQTQTAFEIICVDDGSTDKTPAVLAEYAQKDKRIRVITQSHQGAGAARNKGLSKARGTYVFFMDADDVVVPSFLDQVVDFARKRKAQITLFDGGVLTDGHQLMKRSSSEFLARLDPVFSLKSLTPADRDDFYLETPLVPWNKVFERRFLTQNHIEFGTTQTSEDIYFNLVALGLADAVAYLPETYYYYRADQKKSLSRRRVVDLPAACIAIEGAEKRLQPVFSDLSVCEITERKNLPHVLKAFVRFLEETGADDVCLVLTGPKRSEHEKVFKTIASLPKYAHKIIQTGFVDDADMPALYSGAMGFVYLSLSEGFGLPILEAMQCGIPVISADNTSLPEVGGSAVLYVSGRDVRQTAAAFFEIYSRPALRADLARLGRQQATRFSCTRTSGAVMGKFLSLAADK